MARKSGGLFYICILISGMGRTTGAIGVDNELLDHVGEVRTWGNRLLHPRKGFEFQTTIFHFESWICSPITCATRRIATFVQTLIQILSVVRTITCHLGDFAMLCDVWQFPKCKIRVSLALYCSQNESNSAPLMVCIVGQIWWELKRLLHHVSVEAPKSLTTQANEEPKGNQSFWVCENVKDGHKFAWTIAPLLIMWMWMRMKFSSSLTTQENKQNKTLWISESARWWT